VGLIGKVHTAIIKDLPECRLLSMCDVNPLAHRLADELGVSFYSDYEEMIKFETPEAVIIATPTELHTPGEGVTCAQHGIHLFVEKQLCRTCNMRRH
jgi:predicted dehydrogenase